MNTVAALALNNIGIYLIRHDCHTLAIAAFRDSLSVLRNKISPDKVQCMLNKANQSLACWNDFACLAATHQDDRRPGLRVCRRDIPEDSLVTMLRDHCFEEIVLEDATSFHLVLLRFVETPFTCSDKSSSDSGIFESIILNNLASAIMCAWDQHQSTDRQFADTSLDMWRQSTNILEKMLFDGVCDDLLRSKIAALQVFVLRCIERTATILGLKAVAAEAYNQTMNEFYFFCEIDGTEFAFDHCTVTVASAA